MRLLWHTSLLIVTSVLCQTVSSETSMRSVRNQPLSDSNNSIHGLPKGDRVVICVQAASRLINAVQAVVKAGCVMSGKMLRQNLLKHKLPYTCGSYKCLKIIVFVSTCCSGGHSPDHKRTLTIACACTYALDKTC